MTVRRDPQISINGDSGHRELQATFDGPQPAEQRITIAALLLVLVVLSAIFAGLIVIGLITHELWRAMLIGWGIG